MAKVLVTESSLENIADAIRYKLQVGTVYTPSEMADAIMSIITEESAVADVSYDGGVFSKTINGTTSTVFTADSVPTDDSTNPIQSGAVYDSVANLNNQISNILGDMATVESSTTASKNYVVGEYLALNGVFYKVTVAIAQNGTITPGTNCEETDVGTELTALTSNIMQLEEITDNIILPGGTVSSGGSTTFTVTKNVGVIIIRRPTASSTQDIRLGIYGLQNGNVNIQWISTLDNDTTVTCGAKIITIATTYWGGLIVDIIGFTGS